MWGANPDRSKSLWTRKVPWGAGRDGPDKTAQVEWAKPEMSVATTSGITAQH